jgi:drug/metabolite transporter (DMT)-like permease
VTGIFLIIGACFLWGLDALIRYPLVEKGFSAVSLVFIEHTMLAFLSGYLFFSNISKLKQNKFKPIWYFFVIGGVGSALATVAFTRAFVFVNPSLVIILQKFQPVVAIVLARVVLNETMSKQFFVWAMVCLVGALMISFSDLQSVFSLSSDVIWQDNAVKGYLLIAVSVFGWGAATVFGKKLSLSGFDEKEIMSNRFVFGFLALLPLLPQMEFDKVLISDGIFKIAVMVMISGVLAMYLYYQGLKRVTARACALAELFFPFAAVVVNWIFLDATLNGLQIMGGLVLLLGSSIIQVKKY